MVLSLSLSLVALLSFLLPLFFFSFASPLHLLLTFSISLYFFLFNTEFHHHILLSTRISVLVFLSIRESVIDCIRTLVLGMTIL